MALASFGGDLLALAALAVSLIGSRAPGVTSNHGLPIATSRICPPPSAVRANAATVRERAGAVGPGARVLVASSRRETIPTER